jgi:hypothetical protein
VATTVSVEGGVLTVEVRGLDELWSLASRLDIPLDHVRGAAVDPSITVELIERAIAGRAGSADR